VYTVAASARADHVVALEAEDPVALILDAEIEGHRVDGPGIGAAQSRASPMLWPVPPPLVWIFHAIALVMGVGIPLYAWWMRGRVYAIFAAVVLAFSLPGALLMHERVVTLLPAASVPLDVVFTYGAATAGVQLGHLVRARLRSHAFRLAISIPGQAFLATGALSGLFLLALLPVRALIGVLPTAAGTPLLAGLAWLDLLPLVVALLSVVTSLRLVPEVVRVRLGEEGPAELTRLPVERHRRKQPAELVERSLRIVQISDPHLGPWQSVTDLRDTIQSLLAHEPDLVLLTGDFLTMESQGSPGALAAALTPLAALPGRCFAIFGNHDHEAPEEVRAAMQANGIDLLIDAEALVETPVGAVQLVGADYRGRGRREHLETLLKRIPRRDEALRLLLLHDPSGFNVLPPGDVDLTLSGHTHGGQVGLVVFGLSWTVLSRSSVPDHGLFARGRSRLYVHRGTGFYGFPLRVGVPGEASLLEIIPPRPRRRSPAAVGSARDARRSSAPRGPSGQRVAS
jgi:predicted MPP superfamily phosphohydrolase